MKFPDWTALLQLVIFLGLVVLLSRLLFKPILRLLERREGLIQGGKKSADEFNAKAREMMSQYEQGLAEARQRAVAERERLRAEGLAVEAEMLRQTVEECQRLLEEIKARIQAEGAQASEELRKQAEAISLEIAEKVLERKVQ